MENARASGRLNTQEMKELLDERVEKLASYYCREDLEAAWKDFEQPVNQIPHAMNLRAICLARELDTERFCEDAAYRERAIEETPTKKELLDKLLSLLYDITQSAPAPKDIMGRIVRRLATESMHGDSVRLAILKQFVVKCGFDCKTISIAPVVDWAKAKMSDEELHSYEQLVPKEGKLRRIAAKLDDSIFAASNLSASLGASEVLKLMCKRADKLQERIQNMNPEAPDVKYADGEAAQLVDLPVNGATRQAMRDFCAQYNLPCEEDAAALELMRTISAAFEDGRLAAEDAEMNFFDDLKRAYGEELKKFSCRTRNGGWTTAKSMFEDDQRDARKRKKNAEAISGNQGGGKLVELCGDFAQGRFANNNGKTRIYLFWFALAFGMTVEFDASKRDNETDMVKNLFEDYYNDNILRYLRQKTGRDQESEPSGAGLNFKNYVETIYLYYISRKNDPRTPGEKIDAAERTIERCYKAAAKREGKAGERPLAPSANEPTKTFQEKYLEQILDCEEGELVGRIVDNYQILSDGPNASRVMVGAQTNTAFSLAEAARDEWESDYLEAATEQDAELMNELADELRNTSISIDTELYKYAQEQWEMHLDGEGEEQAEVARENFFNILEHLHSRMSAEFGGVSARQSHFLLYLLRVLANQDAPAGVAALEKALYRYGIVAKSDRIDSGARLLDRAGFAVKISTDGERRYYELARRSYDEPRMQAVMRWAERRHEPNGRTQEKLLYALLKEAVPPDEKRITRSTFIAQLANAYVAQLPEKSILNFPNLNRDFVAYFDRRLIEARYQPINTKNVLDMYVLISIFFYVTINGMENDEMI